MHHGVFSSYVAFITVGKKKGEAGNEEDSKKNNTTAISRTTNAMTFAVFHFLFFLASWTR